MAENRGYTPEELGLVPKAPVQRGYTPEELGLVPKQTEQRGYTPEELGLVPKKEKPEPTPEKESFSTLRQIADVPLQLGKGAVTGVRMIADAFGAGSETSKTLKGGEDYLADLMSAQSKKDSKEISRIMDEAKDKGVLDQVVAGVKALSVAPVDTIINALGTSAPAILAGLATTVVGAPAAVVVGTGAGVGALMGAGTVKGTIYDAVKEELSKTDMPKDQIEARAKLAQDYGGKNLDMILTGAAVGTLGATTGVEPALAKGLAKGIVSKTAQKEIVKEVAEKQTKDIAEQGIKKYAVKQGATEFVTEASQGGQEQFAENLALRREGYDVPLFRGVVSSAVLEGLAGAGMGAGVGINTAAKAKKEVARVNQETKDILKEDLEAQGIEVTDEQLDSMVENVNKIREERKQNVSGDSNRVDAGTDQSGIPVSEKQAGQSTATGAGETTTTDVGGAGQTIAGAGDRTANEPSALTGVNPNLDFGKALSLGAANQAYIQMFDAYKNGSTKMGGLEDSVLRTAKIEGIVFNSPEEIQQYANNNQEKIKQTAQEIRLENIEKNKNQTKPATVDTPVDVTDVESYINQLYILKNKLNAAYDASEDASNKLEKLNNTPIPKGGRALIIYETELEDAERIKKEKNKEFDATYAQIEELNAARKKVTEETLQATETVTTEKTAEETTEEDKIRKANNIPRIETLPENIQQNGIVKRYHSLFDEWLEAKALGDVERQRELLYKMSPLKVDLPEGHPAAMIFSKPKPKSKATDKGKNKQITLDVLEKNISDLITQRKNTTDANEIQILTGKIHKLSTEKNKLFPETISDYANSILNDPSSEEAAKVQAGVEGKTAYEVALWLAQNAPDADYRYIAGRVADRISDMEKFGKKFTFKVVHYGDTGLPSGFKNASVRGMCLYTPRGDVGTEIYVKGAEVTGSVGTSYEVVLHELLHAVTTSAMTLGNFKASVGTDLQKAVSGMFAVTNAIIGHINSRTKADKSQLTEFEQSILAGLNAVENPREVISWTLTNRDMQAYLETIPYKNTNTNMWSALVAAVRNFLKLPIKYDTALSEVLHLTDQILSSDLNDLKNIAGVTQTNLASNIDSPKLSEGSNGISTTLRTLSAAFKNWFGNSKAVDKNGNPLILYRGLVGGEVNPIESRPGYAIFTSDNPYIASSYTGDPTGEFGISNGVVYPMYAKVNKIIEFNVGKHFDKVEFDKQTKRLKPGEALVARNVYDTGPRMTTKMAEGYQNKSGDVWAFATGTEFKSVYDSSLSNIDSPRLSEGSDVLFKPVHPLVDEAIRRGDLRGALQAIVKTGGDYLSNLAARFLSLDTNVVIGYDLQNKLIPQYLQSIEGQKERLFLELEILYPDIYNEHFNESLMLDPLEQLTESFNKLKNGEFGVNLEGLKEDLDDVTKVYNSALRANNAAGFFYNNSVSFNSKFGNGVTTTQTFMHEVTHAFTHWAINNPELLNADQKKALDNLNTLYKQAKLKTKDPSLYGYRNLHEFVAEAFSSVKFQKELRQMNVGAETGVKQSFWSKFMHTVYRILNTVSINKETGKPYGANNILFHTLANTDILFSAKKGEDTSGINSPLMAPGNINVKNGKTLTNAKEIGLINSLINNRQKFSSLNKNNLSSFLGTLNDQYRRYLLGGLTLDQLTDIAGANLPQFKEYVRAIDAMHDTRNKILLEGEQSLKNWSRLLETNPTKAEELGTAMIEATFAKLDPDPKTVGYDETKFKHTKQGQRALAAWKKLESGKDADKAIAIYRDVRGFYERRMEEYIKIELDRLVEREQANNTAPDKIKELRDAREKDLRKDIIRPYFPIKRFGDYWIQIGKGKDKVFMQFENAAARNVALQEAYDDLIKQGHTEEDILGAGGLLDYGNQFKTEMSQKLADYAQLSKLHDLINDTTVEVQSGNAVDKAESLRDKLNENIDQLYLELMPSESIKKMFIHRKNIAGPSQDMLRAFAVSRQRVAYQRSRFQHLPQLFLILEAANKRLGSMPFDEKTKWRDYVRELELNLKTAVLEPPKQSKLTTFATQFGFLQYLTSPASALVNIMAVPGIYVPAAAPKYGAGNVATSLAKYNRMLGGTGFTDERTGKLEFWSLARAELDTLNFAGTEANKVELPSGKTLADVYQAGVSRNVIDVTLSHDAASIGEQPSDEYTGRWQKIMYYASLPFHAAEKYNRETTFMATFDMAYRKYIDKGYTKENAYDAAVDDARDLVQSTMFNYNTINKPRYFRGDLRNIILQFKMYPQHMTVLMFRTFEKGWASNTEAEMKKYKEQIAKSPQDVQDKLIAEKEAELKQLGKEARQQFMGMMGMTFIFAGASGLPLFFIFEAVASAFHGIFGDDEEPFDVNNWFKNWCNETFGGFVGDSISRGVLSQATGLNFADRTSVNLNDMWFPDVKKSNDEVQYMQNAITNLLGPTAGALLNYGEALKRYNDGHVERAIEVIMPAAIKNVMVGTRYLVEGKALTLKGAELDSNVTAGEAFAQMLGFSPEEISQKQKASIEMKGVEQAILNRHTDLLNAFFIAMDKGDSDMLERVMDKIIKFNAANPGSSINADSLRNSVIKRYKDRTLANITGGMSINKKLAPQLNDMLDYSRTED